MGETEKQEHLRRHKALDAGHKEYLRERIRELRFQGEESEFFFEQLPMIFLAAIALFAPAAFYLHERLSHSPTYEGLAIPLIIALLAAIGIAYVFAHRVLRKKDEENRTRIQANYDLLLGRK